jgi:hypothetical protein
MISVSTATERRRYNALPIGTQLHEAISILTALSRQDLRRIAAAKKEY